VAVFVGVAVWEVVDVAVGVIVNLGVLVGLGVFVGRGVFVALGVFVGLGVLVGLGAASTTAGVPPKNETSIRKMIVNRLVLNKNLFMRSPRLFGLVIKEIRGQMFNVQS
jgi:hypothetical protein